LTSDDHETLFATERSQHISSLVVSPDDVIYFDRSFIHEGSSVDLLRWRDGSVDEVEFRAAYNRVNKGEETHWAPIDSFIHLQDVSADGTKLLFSREHLYVLDLGTGAVQQLPYRYTHHAAFSPDGDAIALSYQVVKPGVARRDFVIVYDLARKSGLQANTPGESGPTHLQWSSDGAWLAMGTRERVDGTGGRVLVAPVDERRPGSSIEVPAREAGPRIAQRIVGFDSSNARLLYLEARLNPVPPVSGEPWATSGRGDPLDRYSLYAFEMASGAIAPVADDVVWAGVQA
jgi:dipeptidyl aminopeptidase/acylaminoacyl peptidase